MKRSQPCKELEGKVFLHDKDIKSKAPPCSCPFVLCTQPGGQPLSHRCTQHISGCCAQRNPSFVGNVSRVGVVVRNPRGSLYPAAGESDFVSWTVTTYGSQGQIELLKHFSKQDP